MLVVAEEELTHQEQILGLVVLVEEVLVETVAIQDLMQHMQPVAVVVVDLIVYMVVPVVLES